MHSSSIGPTNRDPSEALALLIFVLSDEECPFWRSPHRKCPLFADPVANRLDPPTGQADRLVPRALAYPMAAPAADFRRRSRRFMSPTAPKLAARFELSNSIAYFELRASTAASSVSVLLV
jgi:hypothetical protein